MANVTYLSLRSSSISPVGRSSSIQEVLSVIRESFFRLSYEYFLVVLLIYFLLKPDLRSGNVIFSPDLPDLRTIACMPMLATAPR